MSEQPDTGTDELLCSIDNRVATLVLNRPEKRNALSHQLTPALRAILPQLDARADVGCIVITGAGSAFCAGGDVSQMGGGKLAGSTGDNTPDFEARVADLQHKQRTLTLVLYELKTPTLAALPGAAAGAGFCIALACDMRIAARSAFVTTAYANIGLSGDYGGSWLLPKLVGPARAKELFFTARRVASDEALQLGIFNTVVDDDELADHAQTTARQIADGPPIAHGYMKSHINQADEISLGRALDLEAEHLIRCARTSDHSEAVQAFMEKRKPTFRGQ